MHRKRYLLAAIALTLFVAIALVFSAAPLYALAEDQAADAAETEALSEAATPKQESGKLAPQANSAGVIAVATVEDSKSADGSGMPIDITSTEQRAAEVYGLDWGRWDINHKIHLELRNLGDGSSSTNKTVEIKLAQGMRWWTDTTAMINQVLDTSKGNKGITREALPKLDGKFDLGGGTRIYHLLDGTVSLDMDLDYAMDKAFIGRTGTPIEDAIVVTVRDGNTVLGTVTLNQAYNNLANRNGTNNLPSWGSSKNYEAVLDKEDYVDTQAITLINNAFSYVALQDDCLITLQLSDSRAKILPYMLKNVVLDESEANKGTYRFRANRNPFNMTSGNHGQAFVYLPGGVAGFKAGDVVRLTAHYELKGYDVNGKPYSIAPQDVTHTFKAVNPKSTIYLNSEDEKNPVKSVSVNDLRMYNGNGPVALSYLSSESREANKTIEQTFDPNAHVYAVFVMDSAGAGTAAGTTIQVGYIPEGYTEQRIKTVTIAEDSMNLDARTNELPGTMLSYADLGLSKGDSITLLRYTIDIPAIKNFPFYALGWVYSYVTPLNHTIEVYHTDTASGKRVSTGVSRVTNTPMHGISLRGHGNGDKIVDAGTTVRNLTMGGGGGEIRYFNKALLAGQTNPIYHIVVSLTDSNGNYLRISNPRATSIQGKEYKLTDAMYTERVVRGLGRVYSFDFSQISAMIPGEKPVFGTLPGLSVCNDEGRVKLNAHTSLLYDIPLPKNANPQEQDYGTMQFVEDTTYDNTVAAASPFNDLHLVNLVEMGISSRIHASGNPYYGSILTNSNTNSIRVRAASNLSVETSAKHHSADEYSTWEAGQAPISIGTKSSFDLKVDVVQGSGQALTNPTYIYIPIPKRNANWGNLLGSDGKPLQFDVTIKEGISTAGKRVNYRAEYANVTPTDSGNKLSEASWSTNFNENANCVRIAIDSIPANDPEQGSDTYSFILNCSVDDSVSVEEAVDTFRPIYWRDLGEGNQTYLHGSYISLQTALGEVRGQAFIDNNKNGKLDANEYLRRAGIEVSAILDGKEVAKATTDDRGEYLITDLNSKKIYVLRAKNPDTKTYVFGRPGTPNLQGQDGNNENQFIGQANDSYGQTLEVFPMRAAANEYTKATYNIGLMSGDAAKTTFTFEAGEGAFGEEKTKTVSGKPTAKVAAPTPTRAGYSYIWYEKDDPEQKEAKIPSTFGYDDKTYVAKWTANTNTKYKVELYYQGRYGVWPTEPNETLELEGTTDATVTFDIKTKAKYTDSKSWGKDAKQWTYVKSNLKTSTLSGKVAGDGSLVLKAFYNIPEGPEPCFWKLEYTGPNKHWGHRPIHWTKDLDVMQGYSKQKDPKTGLLAFGQDDKITRAQIAVILWRMSGRPTTKFEKLFPDVNSDDYFAEAVTWAKKNGVASGKDDGTFAPNNPILRQDLAVMLGNYLRKYKGITMDGTTADFKGLDSGNPRANTIKHLGYAVRNGILTGGSTSKKLNPWGTATRADTAKMIEVFYKILVKN